MPERTSPGGLEAVTRNTIRVFVPLAALKPTAVLNSLYLKSYTLQPLNLGNTLPSLVTVEPSPPVGKTIPSIMAGPRREKRALNVPNLLTRFSNNRSLMNRTEAP